MFYFLDRYKDFLLLSIQVMVPNLYRISIFPNHVFLVLVLLFVIRQEKIFSRYSPYSIQLMEQLRGVIIVSEQEKYFFSLCFPCKRGQFFILAFYCAVYYLLVRHF